MTMIQSIENPTVYCFDGGGLSTGALVLDDSYRVPFHEDAWSPPINSVLLAPPTTGLREIAKINSERTEWAVIPNWIGHVYWLADRSRHEIKEAGVEPPAGWLAEDPGPSLEDAKALRVALMSRACEAAIVAGFESQALGSVHTYPCKLTDQANLQASVSVAREPGLPESWRAPFWCQEPSGEWSYQLHTAEQIRQVGMDGYTATLAKLQRKGLREAAIAAAQTVAEVEAVVWDEPQEVE